MNMVAEMLQKFNQNTVFTRKSAYAWKSASLERAPPSNKHPPFENSKLNERPGHSLE